jgi:mono/diheme cytochrome c family protein
MTRSSIHPGPLLRRRPRLEIALLTLSLIACSRAAVAADPAGSKIARGSYLANGIARCFWCHSPLDKGDPASPIPSRLGSGDLLDPKRRLAASNLTPDRQTGLGTWTDAEIIRAIRRGRGRDGRALQLHPSTYYSVMTDSDSSALVAYLRSLTPIRHVLPRSAISRRTGTSVQPETPPAREEDLSDPLRRGAYLVQLGECVGCHTPKGRDGRALAGMRFAGGRKFFLKDGYGDEVSGEPPPGAPVVASANLTPDPSGIPHYTERVFVQTIRSGKVAGVRPITAAMPWIFFRTMTDSDLAAIYAYLTTVPPARHRVNNTDPPTHCRKCGGSHGLGESNDPM